MARIRFEAIAEVGQIEWGRIGRLPGHRPVAQVGGRGRQAVPFLRFRAGHRPDGFQPPRLFR